MLKVWIPGTSDTTDQGLNSLAWVNDNVTIVDGKLGKSLSFNGSSSRLSLANFQLTNKWSIALWAKCTSASSGWMGVVTLGDTNDANIQMGFFMNPSGNRVQVSFNGKYNSTLSMQNQTEWNHICATYDGSHMLFYLNGVYVSSTAAGYDLLAKQHLTIGAESNNATSGGHTAIRIPFNGQLNDVRIYDGQVLSAKEVEMLARGLILHYPLSREGFGQDNILINSENLKASHLVSGNEYFFINVGQSYMNIPNNTTVTISFDLELKYNTESSYFLIYNTNRKGPKQIYNAEIGEQVFKGETVGTIIKKRVYATITIVDRENPTLTYNSIEFYSLYDTGNVFSVSNLQLELGDKATPWTPNPEDAICSTLHLDNIVHDVSGYKHNGTSSGINHTSDTSKHLVSTGFDGLTNGITIPNLNISNILNNQCTISFWMKPNGDNGGRSVYFSAFNQVSWSIEKTTGNQLRSYWNGSPDKKISEIIITDGSWQHIAIVKDGTSSIKFYYNGELKKELTDTHNELNFGTTWRLGRDTRSNDGTPYKGLMSDFRLYATALSPEAILELYKSNLL